MKCKIDIKMISMPTPQDLYMAKEKSSWPVSILTKKISDSTDEDISCTSTGEIKR